jgi:RNA polymerase sigma-70 factor (ECF subfamily)
VRRLVEQQIQRLDELSKSGLSPLFLHAFVEHNATRSLYRVSLALNVAGRVLAAQEERHDAVEAVREAFSEIERQFRRRKEKLTHVDAYKRPARRKQLRRDKAEAIPTKERRGDLFYSLINQHVEAVYKFSDREIAYRVAVGDLLPNEISAADIVSTVVLRAYREFVEDPARSEIRTWLIRLALEEIEAEVKKSKLEREATVRTEEDISETPPTEAVSTLGDEILDFYQPDEDLKLEDIIPRPSVPTPEQILESRELQQYITSTLARLPRAPRLAFVLRYVEGLPLTEIAGVTGRSQSDIERDLDDARRLLRQRLIESGLTPHAQTAQTVFGTAPEAKLPPTLRRALKKKITRPEIGAHWGPNLP